MEEQLNLFENDGSQNDEGSELEPDEVDQAVEQERSRTDGTTATPTELAGGGSTEDPATHSAGPAES